MIRLTNSGIAFYLFFRDTLFNVWKVDGVTAGYHKVVGNFELRTVNNAGHLVPMDQGAFAHHMVVHFVRQTTAWKLKEEKKK